MENLKLPYHKMSNSQKCRNIITTITIAFLAVSTTFLVYLSALRNDFVEWDDQAYIYENLDIRSVNINFIKRAFTTIVNANWHPLTVISYALDYSIWGLNPFGYHLTNIIFHSFNTLVVFILTVYLMRLGEAVQKKNKIAKPDLFNNPDLTNILIISFLTALFFGLHPLHVESVAWASERKDVLCGFFFLLSIVSYLKYVSSQRRAVFYHVTLILFILALLSKPMAITLPVVFIILDFYPLMRLSLKGGVEAIKWVLIEKIPFLFFSFLSAILTIWTQRHDKALVSFEISPLSERLDIATRGFIFYLKKTLLPINLAPFYVRPLEHEFFNHVFAISLAIILSISLICVFLSLKGKRIFLAVWLYYLITLIPVIGIIQVSDQAAADRYAYLPTIGLFLLISCAIVSYVRHHPRQIAPVASSIIIIFMVMTYLTLNQIAVWKNSVTLWSQEIKIFPTVQAYLKRADAYNKQGNFGNALQDYTVVINNTEDKSSDLYQKRGVAYLNIGYLTPAINDFDDAIAINPQNVSAYFFRANAYGKLGNYAAAIKDYQRALELSPENPHIYFNLGLTYSKAGNKELSILNIRNAARLGLKEALNYLNSRGVDY